MSDDVGAIGKVLFLAPRPEARGTSAHTAHLARELKARGLDVVVFCAPGPSLPVLTDTGVPVTTFPHMETLGIHFAERRRVRAAVEAFAPRLIHVQSLRMAGTARLLSRCATVPLVLTVQTDPRHRRRFRCLSRHFQAIVATTQNTREELVNRCGVERGKVRVIPAGMDVARLDQAGIAPIFGTAVPAVGSLGPVEAHRGHELFIRAAAVLVAEGAKAQFVVAGEGGEVPGLRKLVKSLGLERCVTLATSFADYAEVLDALDIVVQSSLVDISGFSILSAMAYGRPVVAFNTGTACEMIEEGKTGLLATKGDVNALAAAVRRLLGDRELARRLGENARRRVHEEYDIRSVAAGMLGLYSDLLSAGESGGR